MGYGHSIFDGIAVTGELAADARAILTAAAKRGIVIRGPMGTGEPEVTSTRIALNGDGDALSGERFVLGDGAVPADGFVKTNTLPYDDVVTAILVAACVRTGQAPESDGTFADWAPGIALYEQACGPVSAPALELLRQSLDRKGR